MSVLVDDSPPPSPLIPSTISIATLHLLIMVRSLFATVSTFLKDVAVYTPPGLPVALASAYLANAQFLSEFRQELFGTLLMVAFTFSAGKWIGVASQTVAWISHAVGVIGADYFAGGPHVNPAVTLSMWSLGKCSYTEAYVRIAAQMAGGLIAFPLFHALSEVMKWQPFGGPEANTKEQEIEAAMSEFAATFLLCLIIYTLNWEMHFGSNHYIIKQTLTAVAIRILIEVFPTAGPAMNPMLATCWYVFGVGNKFEFPTEMAHYFVYWVAPGVAALAASLLYVIYAGGTFFGVTLPIGPIKKVAAPAAKAAADKKDK